MSAPSADDRARRDAPARVKRDLPLLWIDARFASASMKRTPDPAVLAADPTPAAVVDRIESELHGEATRYRYALWASIATCLMPLVLAAVTWSGMYWLPVRIVWLPFERGRYGLPWLSLYEWIAYLLLAAFLAVGIALIAESHGSTRRLSADYRRLVEADSGLRASFAREVVSAGRRRTELVLRKSRAFAAYPQLLDAEAAASHPDAETGDA